MNRRSFFAQLFAVAPTPSEVSPTSSMTMRRDAHGEAVSLLGYGAMRLPTADGGSARNSSAPLDAKEIARHVDWALAHGVNYFDTAPVYCRGESEAALGAALSRHPRASYKIATKMSNFGAKHQTLAGAKALFEQSLANLRTDYVDYYLLHSVGGGGMKNLRARFLDNGVLDWLVAQRAAGRIRNLGFSFHGDVAVYSWLLSQHDKYKWDFVQIQLNYLDWRHAKAVNPRNVDAEWLYREAAEKRGIPVVAMEPLLGGRLAKFNAAVARRLAPLDPEATPASWAMRFAASHPKVFTVLSGMTRLEHLEENVATYSPLRPLDAPAFAALEACARIILGDHAVPCTACGYCMPCPYGLDIPALFTVWNDFRDKPDFLAQYEKSVERLRRAERCTECGKCQPHCPQGIDIPLELSHIDQYVEDLRRMR